MNNSKSAGATRRAAAWSTMLAVSALLAPFTAPALAHDGTGAVSSVFTMGDGVRAVKVEFSDLDLNSQSGSAALLRRLQRGARLACDAGTTYSLGELAANRDCERRAVDRAVDKIGSPRLAALRRETLAG